MSSNVTIEVQTGSQTARITVPLSAIGAATDNVSTNQAAIAQFAATVLESTGASRTTALSAQTPRTNTPSAAAPNQNGNIRFPNKRKKIDSHDTAPTPNSDPGTPIKVQINTKTGKTHIVKAFTRDTVDSLKFRIQDQNGMPPDQQRLIYAGKQLEDGRPLEDYKITDGTVVYLVGRLAGS